MALISARPLSADVQHECLAIASGEYVTVGTVASNSRSEAASPPAVSVQQLKVSSSPVVCLTFSPTGRLLAACSDNKVLKVWQGDSWEIVGERMITKRSTALQFTKDDKYVLVADKTGEVYRYNVSNFAEEGEHLLGHFSMVLDMVLSCSNGHVITCDRDEKIRVSRYPNAYNIETFCLGHTEFVSKVCLCVAYPNILISGSGDGTIRTWDWMSGKLLHTHTCSLPVDDNDPLAVTWLACSHKAENPVVVASLESSSDIYLFSLHSDGKLVESCDATVSLLSPIWNCTLDGSDHLWACVTNEQEPLVCFKMENSKLVKQTHLDSPILEKLCKWEYFKECICRKTNWSQLRKHVFDNMSAYLARKEERIQNREAQKAAREELKQKPSKIPKLDMQDCSHEPTKEEL